MAKRAIIVHGWQGNPQQGWYQWLGKELENHGFKVHIPAMPDTEDPKPSEWVATLSSLIGEPDNELYLIGHSAGSNMIMKYLGKPNRKIGGAVLVAPWPSLNEKDRRYGKEVGARWLNEEYNWKAVAGNAERITCIFSTNDPYVAAKDSEVFKEKLRCKIVIEQGKKHMNAGDGYNELPSALEAVLEEAKK